MGQVSALESRLALRLLVLSRVRPHVGTLEIVQSTDMVGVHVREQHGADVARRDAARGELRADALVGRNVDLDRVGVIRMFRGEPARLHRARRLAGVHENHAIRMHDRPCEHREVLRPACVAEDVHQALAAMPNAPYLCRLYANGAGLDRNDLHVHPVVRAPGTSARPMRFRIAAKRGSLRRSSTMGATAT